MESSLPVESRSTPVPLQVVAVKHYEYKGETADAASSNEIRPCPHISKWEIPEVLGHFIALRGTMTTLEELCPGPPTRWKRSLETQGHKGGSGTRSFHHVANRPRG